MKRIKFLVGLSLIVSLYVLLQSSNPLKHGRYIPRTSPVIESSINEYFDYIHKIRANQNTGRIDPLWIKQGQEETEKLIKNNKSKINFNWKERGPDNIGGRIRSILVDKNNSNIIFVGSVGGGLWKSTTSGMSWVKVNLSSTNEVDNNLTISCITQAPNGTIYVGTGEGYVLPRGVKSDTAGFIGRGIWKSTDGGNTFSQIPSTIPTVVGNNTVEWAFVNKIAVSPTTGWIYAATNKGLRYSTDGGNSWANPIANNDSIAQDVAIASDGTVAAVVGHTLWVSTNGTTFNSTYYNKKVGTTFDYRRMTVAFAPSNPNYLYMTCCNTGGVISGVFKSTNKGTTWTKVGPSNGANFNVFGGIVDGQSTPGYGWYAMALAVFPDNPDEILLGGIDMWHWKPGSTWKIITTGAAPTSSFYVHSYHHQYVINPNNPNFIYVATDGGIFTTTNKGQVWYNRNKGLAITQFNGISCSAEGHIIGGSQGNGAIMLDGTGNFQNNGRVVYGLNSFINTGVYSYINPHFSIIAPVSNNILRSADNGGEYTTFKADKVKEQGLFPPILLWETLNNPNSTDFIKYVNLEDWTIQAGSWISVPSRNFSYPIWVQVPYDIPVHDTFIVKDVVQAKFFLGLKGAVWMTKDAMIYSTTVRWSRILKLNQYEYATALEITPDGNYLFVGTSLGKLIRVSNVLLAEDSITADEGSSNYACKVDTIFKQINRFVTSISIDPNNYQNVLVTLGNYGNDNYVFYSNNALDNNPSFNSVQANLPKVPAYSSCILLVNSNTALVGTEMGLFVTENLGSTSPQWSYAGMAYVPVFTIKQQNRYFPNVTNYGNIYVGTQGRGAWESTLYYQNINEKTTDNLFKTSLKVFPNPVSDFATLSFYNNKNENITLNIYSVEGRLVKHISLNSVKGNNNLSINVSDLLKGIYIIEAVTSDKKASIRFVKN